MPTPILTMIISLKNSTNEILFFICFSLFTIAPFIKYRIIFFILDFKLPSNRLNLTSTLSGLMSYIDLMNDLISLGTPIRQIIADYIVNQEFYTKKIQLESSNLKKSSQLDSFASINDSSNVFSNDKSVESETIEDNEPIFPSQNTSYQHSVYQKAISFHQPINIPRSFTHITNHILELKTISICDELLFWCIRFEFPEPLVKFLVSLLPDQQYKNYFVRSFVSQYSYISVMMLQSRSEHICSRVVHISVQLFSNESTAIRALNECYLLPVLLSTLHNMLVSYGSSSDNSLLIR